jgi:hypothetical protein
MKTLLETFIEAKKKEYKIPSRQRVPRGNKIGFSIAKYEAALVCALCNFNLKELAEHLNGSYEVIRRWKAENEFKELCASLQKEFLWNIDIELEALASDINSHPCCNLFSDANIYNQEVVEHTAKEIIKYLNKPNGYTYYDRLITPFSGSHQLMEILIQAKLALRDTIIDMAIDALSNPETPELEKKEVIPLLQGLKK